jgi:hypothetical protein
MMCVLQAIAHDLLTRHYSSTLSRYRISIAKLRDEAPLMAARRLGEEGKIQPLQLHDLEGRLIQGNLVSGVLFSKYRDLMIRNG